MATMAEKDELADLSEWKHLKSHISAPLLIWFDRVARPMPWRKLRDPYALWLSEVMLQQTQVKTVIPYFEKFLTRFPDVQSLANAPLQEVLKLWAGLGYYRRARQLHLAAGIVQRDYQGRFPAEFPQILAIPGIGRYTAGAIGSMAFGLRVAVLDGNVMRVLARLAAFGGDISTSAVQKRLWRVAEWLLPMRRVGDFNQAMMELGATVCQSAAPRCEQCPLRKFCRAHNNGSVDKYPYKMTKTETPTRRHIALVIEDAGSLLLLRRPDGGLWGNMWEFPAFEVTATDFTLDEIQLWAKNNMGLHVRLSQTYGDVKHQLTHRTMYYRVFRAMIAGRSQTDRVKLPVCGKARYEAARWVRDPGEVPVAKVTHKILASVMMRNLPA